MLKSIKMGLLCFHVVNLPAVRSSEDPSVTGETPGQNTGNGGNENGGGEEEAPVETRYAFPSAYGAGRHTTDGAGGDVYMVTSLEDGDKTTQGTLHYALSRMGKCTIAFVVSGLVELKDPLRITSRDVMIAGQNAPGSNIYLGGHPVSVQADNVIIRFMRFRTGSGSFTTGAGADSGDALWGKQHRSIIIDHCPMSWSTDEYASLYDNTNFTMQWCITSESLNRSAYTRDSRSYGGMRGGSPATFYHNLLAHHSSRTPRLYGSRCAGKPGNERLDLQSNVFYSWGLTNGDYAGEGGSYNSMSNCYKPGPVTNAKKNIVNRIFQPDGDDDTNENTKSTWGAFYLKGNYFDSTCPELRVECQSPLTSVNNDNWQGLHPNVTETVPLPDGGEKVLQSSNEFTISEDASEFTQSAREAYESVLKYTGASLKYDDIDKRITANVRNRGYTADDSNGSEKGLIDKVNDVGGWPEHKKETGPKGTSGDGIPDEWETASGLDLKSKADDPKYTLSKTYTNLEVYLNGLVETLCPNE